MKNSCYFRTLILLILISTAITGCSISGQKLISLPTATPVTPTPTPRICKTSIVPFDQDAMVLHPKFIVVLYDLSSTEGNYALEYGDSARTTDLFTFFENTFPDLLSSGDEITFFSLGYKYDDYNFARQEKYTSRIQNPPNMQPSPTPISTFVPLATPVDTGETLKDIQNQNNFKATATVYAAEATQVAFDHGCAMQEWEGVYSATHEYFSSTQEAEATAISTQIRGIAQSTPRVQATPFDYENVYEGLSHASTAMKGKCSEYERCILVIFDDMHDWRNASEKNEMPEYMKIRLDNVEVITVMPQCLDIYQPDCAKNITLWQSELTDAGASRIEFLNGDRLKAKLFDLIGEKK